MKKKILYFFLVVYFIFCIFILIRDQERGVSGSEILHTITFGILGQNYRETIFITEFGSEGKKYSEMSLFWEKNCKDKVVDKKNITKCYEYEKYLLEKKVLIRNSKN